jgi:hypothetical protein
MNNTKTLVSLSLLIGIGAALHTVIPGFFSGMKPDMMLTMMFLGIILFPDKKNVLLLGIASGIISGITSTFPGGGLIPNIIDKFITAFLFYFMFLAVKKYAGSIVTVAVMTAIGTLVSGTIFLTSAYFIIGLPAEFLAMFGAAVPVAVLLNTVAMVVIYPIVKGIARKNNITVNA